MPVKNQTLGDMIKLGDLPLEEKEQISDSIRYDAEHNGEFYTEVNHEKLDANRTSMTFMRSYLPKIDKSSDRYINGLVEGVTPDAEEINEAEFSVPVHEIGWYYKFTNKALNHAWLDIKGRCSKFLQNLFKTYHDEKIADAYLASANTVTGCSLLELKDLLRLNTILFKNGAVPFDGYYKLKVAPELGDAMLVAYKDIITHTTQKEAVVIGEIGEIAGFRVIKSKLQAFQKDASNNYAFVAYGKTMKGEFPVSIVAYDDMAEDVMVTPLGGLGNDPLKQRGAIGLYLDGHGFYVFDDSVCIKGTMASSAVTGLSSAVMTHEKSGQAFVFDEAYASKRTANGGAREIIPQYDYVKLYRYSSGTTATTFTLSAVKPDGTAWTFGSSNGNLVATSGNASVATVSGSTLTVTGTGIVTVVLAQKDNANIKTVITVEVVSGAGTSPVAD